MPVRLNDVRRFSLLFLSPATAALFLIGATCSSGQAGSSSPLSAPQAQALVARALATELRTAQDVSHPMRYRLRKSSPRLTSTKEIVETKDGDVARLVSLFDKPLSQTDEQTEEARLNVLYNDPSLQRHRKQGEEGDMAIVLRLLRMLPDAFLYTYAGSTAGPAGIVHKFAFRPKPNFEPPDFETQALTTMTGVLSIDAAQERVTRLEGHLEQDTDYGWGVLGKLDKGGSVVIEQADVGGQQWRIARFQMKMDLRILFKTKNIDTTEEMTQYTPVPANIDYRKAIELLRASPATQSQGGH
ncbi:MAG: hypothetical protein ABSF28_12445 [Terracidiphilus sp.]